MRLRSIRLGLTLLRLHPPHAQEQPAEQHHREEREGDGQVQVGVPGLQRAGLRQADDDVERHARQLAEGIDPVLAIGHGLEAVSAGQLAGIDALLDAIAYRQVEVRLAHRVADHQLVVVAAADEDDAALGEVEPLEDTAKMLQVERTGNDRFELARAVTHREIGNDRLLPRDHALDQVRIDNTDGRIRPQGLKAGPMGNAAAFAHHGLRHRPVEAVAFGIPDVEAADFRELLHERHEDAVHALTVGRNVVELQGTRRQLTGNVRH